jgi:hypothetical protein|nr:MAG TPA: hypothetical protein [Caudoviricetes sp.]DAS04361.1 MAG TPA: hypothetical protein [Caudoviricetes sp.]
MQLLKDRIKSIGDFMDNTKDEINLFDVKFSNVKNHEDVLMFQTDFLNFIKELKSDFLKVLKGE